MVHAANWPSCSSEHSLLHSPRHPPCMHHPVQVITASLQERQPCMFFCKLGKDRTGLIAALVLAACGLSEDEIVADYVR